ncbi:MAG: UMF1 family MFS transporter [Cyclobacteriaceae bacterium]|jgi:UMF1 family MFS transporter
MNKTSSKIINAWCLYDWANSVYLLVITSTIFPVYFNGVSQAAFNSDIVVFFGYEIINTVLYSYSISISFLIVAALSPLLSGIADSSGRKKYFLKFFTYLGSLSSVLLFAFDGHNIEFGIICSVLASIGYSGSLVFYNAYLPDITSAENYDSISARGYSFGYIGSVLLLVVSLLLIENFETLGFSSELQAVKLSFLLVGVWWFGFAQVSFYYLPKDQYKVYELTKTISKGYQEIAKVWNQLKELKVMKYYLVSFFFYSAGVQTVMFLAATFGDKELKMESSKLIATVLVIQLVAILGAYAFAWISKKYSNKTSIMSMLIIWIGVCVYAYLLQTENQFYLLASIVGFIMGGIQSMSRSTFSKLIPAGSVDNTSFFSFYDVTEKLSIVMGTFSYGLIEQLTGSMRNSTLVLGGFFIVGIGLLFLSGLDAKKKSCEVK